MWCWRPPQISHHQDIVELVAPRPSKEHFARVDRNNAAMVLEEEKLRRVAAKEEEATQMLNQGARGVQKLFRGMIARRAFHKLKKQKSKKKGKKGKKKGKK